MMLAECGMLGEVILQRLWRSIYRNKGYYYEFGPDECLLMSRRIGYGLRSQEIMEVVNVCLSRNIFDLKLYRDYSILTSKRIQEIYLVATVERTSIQIDARFLLISLPRRANITVYNSDLSTGNPPKKAINRSNTGGEIPFIVGCSTEEPHKSADIYTKESKGKESEGKESEIGAPPVTLFSKEYFKIPIEKRKDDFRGAVGSFINDYDGACLDKFFMIWSELNPTGKRMKFELQQTWDLAGRLYNWAAGWKAVEEKKKGESKTGISRMQSNKHSATSVLQEILKENEH
jgi:hypothetical protein